MRGRWRGRALFVALWLFSSATTAGHFGARGTLYGDTLLDYSFFYNNLQSLNVHGEPAWWFPNSQMGYPGYFFSMVSLTNAGMPAFVALGSGLWLLGRLGVTVTAYQPIYVFYFGAFVPLLFLIGVWMLARQLFRSGAVVAYLLVVAAFSPGVLMNLSDLGALEHTAYALYFASALLRFLQRPAGVRSFLLLALAAILVGLSLNYLFLVTTAPLLLCLGVGIVLHRRFRVRAGRVLGAQPRWRWALLVAVVGLGAVPNVLAYARQGGLAHERTGLVYSFDELKTGNPWEALLAGSPGVGFEWDEYYDTDGRPNRFQPRGLFKAKDHLSYGYLGLLVWPLALEGLWRGRRRLRLGLLAALAIYFGVILLGGFSGLFATALVWPTPLRGMSHFSDMLYRDSGFLVLLLASGLGLESAARARGRRLELLFAAVAAASLLVTAKLHDFELGTPTGFAALLAVLIAVVLAWRRRSPGRRRLELGLLVALTLLDVSTSAFWYVRLVLMRYGSTVDDTPHADGLGIAHRRSNWGSGMLHFPEMAQLGKDGLPVDRLPLLAVFGAAHFYADRPARDDFDRALARAPEHLSLGLAPNPKARDPLLPMLRPAPPLVGAGAQVAGRSFNALEVDVESGAPALLFVRDAFSPYWKARVDGKPAPLYRALGNFKAVPVPAGRSRVVLRFSPPGLAATLAAAYAAVALLAVAVARTRDGSPA